MSPLLALEFLTIVRVRPARRQTLRAVARSQAFFPSVGLILGLMLLGIDHLTALLFPPLLRNAALVVGLIILTGGLHLDGLGDTADGVLGGHSPEERLTIMKDPRLGSFGMLAIASLLLLKWSALTSLTSPLRAPALLLAPALGRWAVVVAVAAVPYGRPQGAWSEFHRQAWPVPTLIAGGTALIAGALLLSVGGAALFAGATGLALGIALFLARRLAGLTGDTYGAIIELTETAVLMAVVAMQQIGVALR